MDRVAVEHRFEVALDNLYYNDSELLKNDSSEWSVTHKLGEYLQHMFLMYHVDNDYNREPGDNVTKTLSELSECDSNEDDPKDGERNIRPDILVHERGHHDKNLVAIEVKLDASRVDGLQLPRDAECDHAKLRELTSENHDFKYEHGVFIDLPVKDDVFDREIRMQWYPEDERSTYQPINE